MPACRFLRLRGRFSDVVIKVYTIKEQIAIVKPPFQESAFLGGILQKILLYEINQVFVKRLGSFYKSFYLLPADIQIFMSNHIP